MSGQQLGGVLSLDSRQFIANLVAAGQATDKQARQMAGALKFIETQMRANVSATKARLVVVPSMSVRIALIALMRATARSGERRRRFGRRCTARPSPRGW